MNEYSLLQQLDVSLRRSPYQVHQYLIAYPQFVCSIGMQDLSLEPDHQQHSILLSTCL